jgi:hypothetical protein
MDTTRDLLLWALSLSLPLLFATAPCGPARAQEAPRTRAPEAQRLKWEEANTDRPGSDYRSFEALRGLQQCQEACKKDQECRSYTFAKANKRCWLKSSVPSARPSDCCVSGAKTPVAVGKVTETGVVPQMPGIGATGQAIKIPAVWDVQGKWQITFFSGSWERPIIDIIQDGEKFYFVFPDGNGVKATLSGKAISGTCTERKGCWISGELRQFDQQGRPVRMIIGLEGRMSYDFVRLQ